MRSTTILPLLAVAPLLGCDGTGEWTRGPAAAAAYGAPLAGDTTVVTTRRVWTSSDHSLNLASIMPDGAGLATTDWPTGDPAVLDLASRELRRLRINGDPYDTGLSLGGVPSRDGGAIAVHWVGFPISQLQIRVVDVATGASRTIMSADTAIADGLWPVAWTPAGDSVFATIWPARDRAGDVNVVLIPVKGGTPRRVHTVPPRTLSGRRSLSPDGRWLLYDHQHPREEQTRSDIYIIDVQRGGARPLVEHNSVNQLMGWLPGTDVVLFSSDRSGTTDLWSVRVANGRPSAEPRRVRSGFFRGEGVGFGGGALFYSVRTGSSGASVINVDPQSGALNGPPSPPLEHLGAGPGFMAWSRDGQAIAARSRGNSLTVHSMVTGESRVFWLDDGVAPARMEWAADGKALFVRAGETTGMVPRGTQYFLRLDLATGTTTRLFAEEDPKEAEPLWRFLVTPDGRSIVLRQQRTLDDGRTEMKLVLRSLEDGSERELYRTSGYIPELSLSADGTQLAFMQQVWEGSDSLFVMRMDGSEALRYVASWRYDAVSLLGWLSSGTALLAARLTEDRTGEEILRIELDGTATVIGISPFKPARGDRRTQGYHRSRLLLSPAGNRLAHQITVDPGKELWRMDGLHALFTRGRDGRR